MPNRRFVVLGACVALILVVPRGRAAESDALAINANIQARHLPYGTILDPIFTLTDSDQIARTMFTTHEGTPQCQFE
jgi:hypothetical protein